MNARPTLFLVFVLAACVSTSACDKKSDAPKSNADPSANGASASSDGAGVIVLAPKEDAALADVLKDHAAKAKALHLKLFVELSATWCGPCKAIEQYKNDPAMAHAYRGTYVVQLDVDKWGGQLKKNKLESSAVPCFFALDDDSTPTARSVDGSAWDDNIPANMAPVLDKFFHQS